MKLIPMTTSIKRLLLPLTALLVCLASVKSEAIVQVWDQLVFYDNFTTNFTHPNSTKYIYAFPWTTYVTSV
jgi:hypothetical protein